MSFSQGGRGVAVAVGELWADCAAFRVAALMLAAVTLWFWW